MNDVILKKSILLEKAKEKFSNLYDFPIKQIIYGLIGSIIILVVLLVLPIEIFNEQKTIQDTLQKCQDAIQKLLDFHITIFIGSFSFLAIVFAVIQIMKNHDDVISDLFEATYVFQFLSFISTTIFSLVYSQMFVYELTTLNSFYIYSQIALILEISGLCYMFFQIYRIVSSNYFLDKLIEKVKKLVFEGDEKSNQIIKMNRYNKILKLNFTSIYEYNLVDENKCFNLFKEIFENNLYSDFTHEYYRQYLKEFESSISHQNSDFSLRLIVSFRAFLHDFSVKNNVSALVYFKDLPKYQVNQILKSDNKNSSLTRAIILRLFEIIKHSIRIEDTGKIMKVNIEIFISVNINLLYMINQCLVQILEAKDIDLWKYALNELNNLENIYNRNDIKTKDFINIQNQLLTNIKLLKLGLYSWTLENFLIGNFTKIEFDNFVKEINFDVKDLKEIVDLCVFCINYEFKNTIFGWETWDTDKRERLSYKMEYYKPVSSWLIQGLFLIMLDYKWLFDKQNKFIETLIVKSEFKNIGNSVKYSMDLFLKKDKNKLLSITKESEESFNEEFDTFTNFFTRISSRYFEIEFKEIAMSPLSNNKIEKFKKSMFEQWKENQFIEKIFYDLNLIEKSSGTNNLPCIYQNYLLTTGKKMFIEENFELIYGINFGALVSQSIDSEFINLATSKDSIKSNSMNLITTLDQEIEDLKNNSFKPNLIIIDSILFYERMEGIEMLKNREAKIDFNNNFQMYEYKGIDLIPIHNVKIKDKVVVSDFKDSFKMLQHRNPEWYDDILKIEITEVTEDEARKKFLKDKEKMTKIEIETLDEQLEIYRRMNDIKILVCEYVDFEIKDKNAFKVIEFRNEDLLN